MSAIVPEILCTRCGTPFPRERGKVAVVCPACGQLRPDLLTLDDIEEDAPSKPQFSGPLPAYPQSFSQYQQPPKAPVAPISPGEVPAPLLTGFYHSEAPAPPPFDDEPKQPTPKTKLARSEPKFSRLEQKYVPTVKDQIGLFLLVLASILAGGATGMVVLNAAPNFESGTWYAVGTVFVLASLLTVLGGLLLCGMPPQIGRLGSKRPLQVVFVIWVALVAFACIQYLPSRIIFQEHAFPSFRR